MRRALLILLAAGWMSGCTLDPVNPAFPADFDTARRQIAEMRQAPKRLDRPLVIIGGFGDPNVSPPLYRAWFERVTKDSRIVIVSVGFCQSFAECRRKVIEAVDEAIPSSDPIWTAEVDVVGASLGGLVARYAAALPVDHALPRRLRIARLFSISSPHAGAVLADHIALLEFHRDMKPGSAFLRALASQDVEAGYELYPYVRLHDETVGEDFAFPPGRAPLWLPNPRASPAHAGAMMDDRILADIARRLRGESPISQLPPAPLPR